MVSLHFYTSKMYPHDPLISKKNRENYVSIWHCTPSPTLSSLELPPLFSLLQLREAKGERPVLPPARSPFPSASGGPRALGCVRERRLSAWRCRLGTSSSMVRFPAAASSSRNNVLSDSSSPCWCSTPAPAARPWRFCSLRGAPTQGSGLRSSSAPVGGEGTKLLF